MTYKERLLEYQRVAKENLSNQPSMTFEQMKEQVERLKRESLAKDNRKKRQPITDEEIQRILNETYGCDSML